MRISIIYTDNGPFKVFLDENKAYAERKRLQERELDEDLFYSVISMPIQDRPHNKPMQREEKPTYCGGCGYTHTVGSKCPGEWYNR